MSRTARTSETGAHTFSPSVLARRRTARIIVAATNHPKILDRALFDRFDAGSTRGGQRGRARSVRKRNCSSDLPI
jgi:hypothetical protein